MDTGITELLTNFYRQGVRRGYSKAKIDRLGLRALLFTAGWALGVITGLVSTGWL